ncbi:hypothetical protein [Acinetobacter oleivorans]|uniref:hypothetical protein n=1 Tax=Acinetobacter oleivorans TaxID=1148157 RepID=UPI00226CB225|nr:hypothetical protein [Acinetobacter oleivorans]
MSEENQQLSSFEDFLNANNFQIDDYFRSKTLPELTISELVYIYLNTLHGFETLSNGKVYSSLYDLLDNTRSSFSRQKTRIYTPLLSCFAIIDQLGSIFDNPAKSTNYQNGILSFLTQFSSLNDDEIKALNSLRNGLYHDGSLTSIGRFSNRPNVVFRLNPDMEEIIKVPQVNWDGIYYDELKSYLSFINTRNLFLYIEEIIESIKRLLLEGKLQLKITDPREFYYKYLFSNFV